MPQTDKPLRKLSSEHGSCFALADALTAIARSDDESRLAEGVEMVREYNSRELEAHLRHEEQTIFRPLIDNHPEHAELCMRLGREHGRLRSLVEDVSVQTAQQDLADFAELLREHSRVEEYELFPIIESLFSQEQLQLVKNFVPRFQ